MLHLILVLYSLAHILACAFLTQILASAKGYSETVYSTRYFWLGLFFNIIALLFVVGLPDIRPNRN